MSKSIGYSIWLKAYISEQCIEIHKTIQYQQYSDQDIVTISFKDIPSLIEALQQAQTFIEGNPPIAEFWVASE